MISFKIPFRLPSYNEFQNENRRNRYACESEEVLKE